MPPKRILAALAVVFFFVSNSYSQLNIGDVAFTHMNTDNPDEFSIVLLTDISVGQVISFTDNGWRNDNTFRTSEDVLTWTSTANMTCGTQITFQGTSVSNDGGFAVGTISGDALSLSSSGDQIFAFSGSLLPTFASMNLFLAAIQNNNGGWDSNATSSQTSARPPVFIDGVNALVFSSEIDNAAYNCVKYASSDVIDLREALNDFSNYNTDNGTRFSVPGCNFQCTDLPPVVDCPSDVSLRVDDGICGAEFNFVDPTCSEFCSGVSVSRTDGNGFSSGDIFPVGVTTISYEITNTAGTSTCEYDVTIIDDVDPEITCPDDTSIMATPFLCGQSVTYVTPTASDNCGLVSVSQTDGSGLTTGDVFNLGVTEQSYAADDGNSNSQVCSFNIEIIDTIAPELSCLDSIKYVANASCEATISYSLPTVTDNCSVGLTSTQIDGLGISSGDVVSGGSYLLEFEAVDLSGNSSSCTSVLFIEDVIAPIAFCPSDEIIAGTDPSSCGALVNTSAPLIMLDECSAPTYTITNLPFPDGTIWESGTYNLNYEISDASGNTFTCQTNLTIQDVAGPIINCPNDTTLFITSATCQAEYVFSDPSLTDNCDSSPTLLLVTPISSGDLLSPGVTTINYSAFDISGNVSTCSYDVEVTDNLVPVLTCSDTIEQDVTVIGACSETVNVPQPAVSDLCSLPTYINNITGTDNADGTYNVGNTDVIWTVTSATGVSESCTTVVRVNDVEAPLAFCPSDEILPSTDPLTCGTLVNTSAPLIMLDACSTPTYTITNLPFPDGTVWASGSYDLNYEISDASGNTFICQTNITIQDIAGPIINCPNDTTLSIIPSTCQVEFVFSDPSLTDNCDDSPTLLLVSPISSGDLLSVGITTINYSAFDASGNVSTCSYDVEVIDDLIPVLTCTDTVDQDITVLGLCSETVNVPQPLVSDLCSTPTFINNITGTDNADGVYNVGNTDVIWTVTSATGVAESCTTNVRVNDTEGPVIVCPPNQSLDLSPSSCTMMVNVPLPVASDNCTLDFYTNDFNNTNDASGLYNGGVNTVTYTAFDEQGNSGSCVFTVTVNDLVVPVISCPSDTTIYVSSTSCDIFANLNSPLVDDNCSSITFNNDYNNTSDASGVYSEGVTNILWTATDPSGNTDQCSQIVTVLDTVVPSISCVDTLNFFVSALGCQTEVLFSDPFSSDNCSSVSISRLDATGVNTGDVLGVDTLTLIYQSTDLAGNTNSCHTVLSITDTIAPAIICPPNQIVSIVAGSCEAPVIIPVPNTIDNCGSTFITNDFNNSDNASGVFPGGTSFVEFTVTDLYGNSDRCVMEVVVDDTISPSIVCPDDTLLYAGTSCDKEIILTQPIVEDNCSGYSLINDFTNTDNASGIYPIGLQNINWTVTDVGGNTNSCIQLVNVVDTISPSIACQDTLSFSISESSCLAEVSFLSPEVTDNCIGSLILNRIDTNSLNSGDFIGLDTLLLSFEAIDIVGNRSVCNTTIIVTDSTAPNVVCPPDMIISIVGSSCDTVISTIDEPINLENCGLVNIERSDTTGIFPGDVVSAGEYTLIYDITDGVGNLKQCLQFLMVTESNAPVVVYCPNDTVINADNPEFCGVTYMPDELVVIDNCSDVSINLVNPSGFNIGDTLDVGITSFAYVVIDQSGNTSTCEYDVTVLDTIAPQLICKDTLISTTDSNCTALIDLNESWGLESCGISNVVRYDNVPNSFGDFWAIGEYDIDFSVEDLSGNISRCALKIEVQDLVGPSFDCPSDTIVYTSSGDCEMSYEFVTPEAVDLCSKTDSIYRVDSTEYNSGDLFPVGIHEIIYEAIDSKDNLSRCSYSVSVRDTVGSMVLACPADTIICDSIVDYDLPNVTLGCIGIDSIYTFSGPSIGEVASAGVYPIVMEVLDSSGITKQCSFNLEVRAPLFVDAGEDLLLCGSEKVSLSAVDSSIYKSTYWESVDTTINIENPDQAFTTLDTLDPGIYDFIWNVTDSICFGVTDTMSVIVGDPDFKPYLGLDTLICDITFSPSVRTFTGNGSWSFDSTKVSVLDSLHANTIFAKMSDGVVELIWSESNGSCGLVSDTIVVSLGSRPVVLSDTIVELESGSSHIIDVSSINADSITWIPTDFLSNSNGFITITNTTQDITYEALVYDEYGCESSMLYEVRVTEKSDSTDGSLPGDISIDNINNVITPNGDGKNDTWVIENVSDYSECTFAIYNRWGQEIYSSIGYDNSWNGVYNGKELPEGAYYYMISCDNEVLKAAISIVRYSK